MARVVSLERCQRKNRRCRRGHVVAQCQGKEGHVQPGDTMASRTSRFLPRSAKEYSRPHRWIVARQLNDPLWLESGRRTRTLCQKPATTCRWARQWNDQIRQGSAFSPGQDDVQSSSLDAASGWRKTRSLWRQHRPHDGTIWIISQVPAGYIAELFLAVCDSLRGLQ